MKSFKICLLITSPIALAAMFGNACYTIANAMQWLEHVVNYIPAFFALSFFAFWAFFAATAQIVFPSVKTAVKEQKIGVSAPVYTHPCNYKITRFRIYAQKPLFNSLNIG